MVVRFTRPSLNASSNSVTTFLMILPSCGPSAITLTVRRVSGIGAATGAAGAAGAAPPPPKLGAPPPPPPPPKLVDAILATSAAPNSPALIADPSVNGGPGGAARAAVTALCVSCVAWPIARALLILNRDLLVLPERLMSELLILTAVLRRSRSRFSRALALA